MQDLTEAEQKLASLTNDYASTRPPVVKATSLVNAINGQIDAQVEGVIKGLQAKMEADLDAAKALRDKSGPVPPAHAEASTVTDDEDQEIRRIQTDDSEQPGFDQCCAVTADAALRRSRQGTIACRRFPFGSWCGLRSGGQQCAVARGRQNGNRAMVELLFGRGADVNTKEIDGTYGPSSCGGQRISRRWRKCSWPTMPT